MIKLILAAAIGGSCLRCCNIKSSGYILRVSELVYLRDMLLSLSREIAYRKDPVALSLGRIKNQIAGLAEDFISDIICGEITDFQRSWELAADSIYGGILTDEDIGILKEAGAELGASGIMQQQSMIEMITAKLDLQIQKADEEYRTKGRMYRAIGGFCGACAIILLI